MDKINCIQAFILTNSGEEIYFYLRLDQIIALAYANDPKYKDNYFMVVTNYNGDGDEYFKPFYYVHKDIIHKCFNLEQMPARYFFTKEEYDAYKNSEVTTTSIQSKVE